MTTSFGSKLEASLTDDASVVIYGCHMFIVPATEDFAKLSVKIQLNMSWLVKQVFLEHY